MNGDGQPDGKSGAPDFGSMTFDEILDTFPALKGKYESAMQKRIDRELTLARRREAEKPEIAAQIASLTDERDRLENAIAKAQREAKALTTERDALKSSADNMKRAIVRAAISAEVGKLGLVDGAQGAVTEAALAAVGGDETEIAKNGDVKINTIGGKPLSEYFDAIAPASMRQPTNTGGAGSAGSQRGAAASTGMTFEKAQEIVNSSAYRELTPEKRAEVKSALSAGAATKG